MLSSPSSSSSATASVPPPRLGGGPSPTTTATTSGILHHHPVQLLRGGRSWPSSSASYHPTSSASSSLTPASFATASLTAPPTTAAAGSLGVCSTCGGRITSAAAACQALGCFYHNDCFICCCCRRTLRGKTFYKDQDKIYCEEDYLYHGFQRMAEKCAACGHIISQSILQGMGKSYHPGCFRCCICNKCMDGEKFTVDADCQIYCLYDYYLVNAPTCAACAYPILPEGSSEEVFRVVAMSREFHVKCYRCEDCNMLLSDEATTRCYPLVENIEGGTGNNSSTTSLTHLLCLNCHLARIGASSPEPYYGSGDLHHGPRWRPAGGGSSNGGGGGGSSSSSSPLDLGAPGGGFGGGSSRVYSPTPTSYGVAPISSRGPTADSSTFKATKPWSTIGGRPGGSGSLNSNS